jgi:DNA-directed RNA polymerase subunit RPC12/RpoP
MAVADPNAGFGDHASPANDGEAATGLDAAANNTIMTAVDPNAGWGADTTPAVASDGDWGITGDAGGWDTGPAPGVDDTNMTPSFGGAAYLQSSTPVPGRFDSPYSLPFSPPAVQDHSAYICPALGSFSSYEPPTGGGSPGGAGTGIGQFGHISPNQTYEEPLRSLNPLIAKGVGGGEGPVSVYRCHDCEKAVEFRFREWMRCPECGCRVFRKDRRRVIAQFEAR